LLLTSPPNHSKHWSNNDLSSASLAKYQDVILKLLALEHGTDERGEQAPIDLALTTEALARWVEFYDDFAAEQAVADCDDLAASLSKIEGYCARFALVFQLVQWADGAGSADAVHRPSVEAGIALARWFANESKRIYESWRESDEARQQRELVSWIRRRGGSVTVRSLTHGLSRFREDSPAARAALDELVESGVGRWACPAPGAQGGRPAERFELASVAASPSP
jgi:hypothetical protein